MQKRVRGVLSLCTLILVVGMAGSFWKQKGLAESLSKSAQVYWNETQISEHELLDLLTDDSCQSSQKYFLACVNSIQNAAQKFQLELQFDGQFVETKMSDTGVSSEKSLLEPWRQFYLTNSKNAGALSFLALWKNLKDRKIKKDDLAMTVALGLNGFLSVFRDPHTYLIPAAYYNEVVAQLNPKTLSLGVVVARGLDEYFVRKVLDSSPADQAGLKKGDVLLKINNQKIQDLTLQKVGDLMHAEEGDTTELVIQRGSETKSVVVKRSSTPVPTVSWKYQAPKNYAVLTINKFAKGTCDKTKESLLEIQQKHVRGLLIDLRDNSGGQMEEAACIASLFLGKDREILTLQYRDSNHESEVLYGHQEQIYFGALGVLINSGTASAAEILAGVLQEYHRAVLVGERTFGKGTFQEGEIWESNSQIALFETKGFFTMPSGRSPQIVGILPDVAIEFKKTKVLREEDLYMNPLHPMALTKSQDAQISLKLERCSDNSNLNPIADSEREFDPQMDKATALLSCPAVADNMTGF